MASNERPAAEPTPEAAHSGERSSQASGVPSTSAPGDATRPGPTRPGPTRPGPTRPGPTDWVGELARRAAAGEPLALATVTRIDGSASARAGSKALFDAAGRLVLGWVGGGCAESAVRDAALECLRTGVPRALRLDLDDEVMGVGMPCGGFMELFVEPVIQPPRLLVLGHGAIAETLVAFGKPLGFHVTVHDPLATPERFPAADVRISDDPEYAKAESDARTYVVVTTQHKSDFEALLRVLSDRPAYVSLVASRKRAALVIERLDEAGVARAALSDLRAPAGLDIGAATPQEIALSILAEIVAERRGRASGRPLFELRGELPVPGAPGGSPDEGA